MKPPEEGCGWRRRESEIKIQRQWETETVRHGDNEIQRKQGEVDQGPTLWVGVLDKGPASPEPPPLSQQGDKEDEAVISTVVLAVKA